MVPTPHTTKLGITVSGKQMLHEQSSPYTVLFFIRHGQVENPQKVIYERLPGFHLSEKGQQQVQTTARYLTQLDHAVHATALYSSPLDRTVETSQILLKELNTTREENNLIPLSLTTDPHLIEAGNAFRGQRLGHGKATPFSRHNLAKYLNIWKPGWGESYAHISQRMCEFTFDRVDAHPGESFIIISHESPIWTLCQYLETGKASSNVLSRETALASITTLLIEPYTHCLKDVWYIDPNKETL